MKATEIYILLEKLTQLIEKENSWLDKLPSEINSAFFDNPSNTNKGIAIDTLLDFIFTTWAEDVSYFLYEPSPHVITTDKKEYVINNTKEYIDYMVNEGFLEDDRI